MKMKKMIPLLVIVLFFATLSAQMNVTITDLITDLSLNGTGSQYIGPSVRIEGYVTIGANRAISPTQVNLQMQAYVQDANGYGILVYRAGAPNATVLQTFTRGNVVEVIGRVGIQTGQYAGGYQITHESSSEIDYPYPDDFIYGLARVLSISQASNYQGNNGSFVKVTGALTENPFYNTNGVNLNINDGTATRALQVRIWDTAVGLPDKVRDYVEGTRVYVYGVVYVFNGNPQLLPGYLSDVYENTDPPPPPPPSEFDKLHGSLQIIPKAYNIYENEKVEIRYTAENGAKVVMRIYNSEGKLMATPANLVASATNAPVLWNGRDNDYRLVEPGLYICNLEVQDRNSGKKKAYTAPIVVGMRLK